MPQLLRKREDCILIVIDVQEKLMPVIHDKDEVIINTARLVQFSGLTGIPVIFTEQQKLGPTLSVVRESVNDFKPIEKVHFNCFLNPEFSGQGRAYGEEDCHFDRCRIAHMCRADRNIGLIRSARPCYF